MNHFQKKNFFQHVQKKTQAMGILFSHISLKNLEWYIRISILGEYSPNTGWTTNLYRLMERCHVTAYIWSMLTSFLWFHWLKLDVSNFNVKFRESQEWDTMYQ